MKVWMQRASHIALAVLALFVTMTGTAETIVIDHVTVIDAVDGARADQRVVVQGDRIVSVGPAGGEPVPGAQHVDGSGRFLIPGLWDMHVHFLYDPHLQASMADRFLDYGVTSVRDTGGNLAQLREHVASLADAAPRVFYSGPLLDGRWVVYEGDHPARPALGIGVPSAEAARARVQEVLDGGATFIKIYELVDPEVFHALVAAAEAAGVPIASHVPLQMTADTAGPHVDSMEHLRNIEIACAENAEDLHSARLDRFEGFEGTGYELRSGLHRAQRTPAIAAFDAERCARVMQALTDTIQVPTLRLNGLGLTPPWERPGWEEAFASLPEAVQAQWGPLVEAGRAARSGGPSAGMPDPAYGQWSLDTVAQLLAAGVPIGAGTDTPIGISAPGYSLHSELEMLVRAGMSPLQALGAATVVPARFFDFEDEGRIAAGHRADLVLLTADPMRDIGNTRSIERVMASGRWVR